MGVDAAWSRSGRRRGGVVAARLGPPHRQDTPWRAAARAEPPPKRARRNSQASNDMGPPANDELVFNVVDALDIVAKETGKTVPQVALNWLLQRPTVSTLVIGARNEQQLKDNIGATGWTLTPEQIKK